VVLKRCSASTLALLVLSACAGRQPNSTPVSPANQLSTFRPTDMWLIDSKEFPWRAFTRRQRATIAAIRVKVLPRYRQFLRAGRLGPGAILGVFVSRNSEPPEYGGEGVALNECHSTPTCKYLCNGRYSGDEIGPDGPSGSCEDTALFFYKDAAELFPYGQMHVTTPAPCVHISGRAFGSCSHS
jgi:hypothetical protein